MVHTLSYNKTTITQTKTFQMYESFTIEKSGKYKIYLVNNNKDIIYVNAIIYLYNSHNHHKAKIVDLNSNQSFILIHLHKDLYQAKIIYIIIYSGNISQNNLGIQVKIVYNGEY